MVIDSEEWRETCEQAHGTVLRGLYAHWCDGKPFDETCDGWPCRHAQGLVELEYGDAEARG